MAHGQALLTPIFGISPEYITHLVNIEMLEQHLDEVSFQWFQHRKAITQPNLRFSDIIELDDYIDANLDGICLGNEVAWKLCEQLLADDADYMFPAVMLAFRCNNKDWLNLLLDKLDDEHIDAFIDALGWLDFDMVSPFLNELLQNKAHPLYQYITLSAYAQHRKTPAIDLRQLLQIDIPLVKIRVIQLIGELKCHELRQELHIHLTDEQEDVCYWAAWSLALLGEQVNIIPILQNLLERCSEEYQVPILHILMRICDETEQSQFIDLLVVQERLKLAIHATGIAGRSNYIPWLIEMMHKPELAKLAGEAFCLITGADLEYEDLDIDEPDINEELNDSLFDNNDDEPEEDEYEQALLAPDPEKIMNWWNQFYPHYQSNLRYLVGKPITEGHLYEILQTGFQRQRIGAALELTLLQPHNMFIATNIKATRQIQFSSMIGEG